MRNFASATWLWAMLAFSLLVALYSWRFIPLGIERAFDGLGAAVMDPRLPFVVHVVAAPVALATGAAQFLPRLRSRRPAIHRWTGRTYGVAVLLGGIGGLWMALDSFDRPVAALGFGTLAILWLLFTARGVAAARARRFDAHRAAMIRSFALAFGAVTLRVQLPIFFIFILPEGSTYLDASPYVAWTAWVPNLLIAELWLRRRARDSRYPRST